MHESMHIWLCMHVSVPMCMCLNAYICVIVCVHVLTACLYMCMSACVFLCKHCDDEMSVSGEKGGSGRKENCLDELHMVSYLVRTTTMCTVTMGVTMHILQKGLVNSGHTPMPWPQGPETG